MRMADRQIRGGEVILLLDGSDVRMGYDRSASIEATDRILTRWKADGMRFVTIPEPIEATGFAIEPASSTSREDA